MLLNSSKIESVFSQGFLLLFLLLTLEAGAQTELRPWGNITGIRVEGQLIKFETRLLVFSEGRKSLFLTGKEMQRPKYTREGDKQIVTTELHQIQFTEEVTDSMPGEAKLRVKLQAREDVAAEGAFVGISILESDFKDGKLVADQTTGVSMHADSAALSNYFKKPLTTLQILSERQRLVCVFNEPTQLQILQHTDKEGNWVHVLVPLSIGNLKKDAITGNDFIIRASAAVDKSSVKLSIDPSKTGRVFEGFGGNFRLQNPMTDPQVISYCLNNMRLAWGRVEMPWRFWQPELNSDPLAGGKKKLSTGVQNAMEMAQRLDTLGIPVILSAWSAPAWAVVGEPKTSPGPDGVWGNPLNPENVDAIIKSIGDYVVFLKEHYGVEISMFSFNESDLGINIRQTGAEHAALIKKLGAHFRERGLKTKMLLGDNSDANSYEFIYPAMNDPETHSYIGAISFHSWRGWERETLQKWADAAAKMNLPLLIGEGSIDAQAWGYPHVFLEPTYAREEINLYVRLLNICQPASILQWQLTADYSPMAGGGIFGDNGPLRPTQRFWNLKQLASTPENLKALHANSDKEDISIAGFGDASTGKYAVHLVNNGSTRTAELSGLPSSIKSLKVFITDDKRNMEIAKDLSVKKGKVSFLLEPGVFMTLVSE